MKQDIRHDVVCLNPFDGISALLGVAVARGRQHLQYIWNRKLDPQQVLPALSDLVARFKATQTIVLGNEVIPAGDAIITKFPGRVHVLGLKVPESDELRKFVSTVYAGGHFLGVIWADDIGLERWKEALDQLTPEQREGVLLTGAIDELPTADLIAAGVLEEAKLVFTTRRASALSDTLTTMAVGFDPPTFVMVYSELVALDAAAFKTRVEEMGIVAKALKSQTGRMQ